MSKKRTSLIFINDIIHCINKIEKYTKNMNIESFENNDLVIDGTLRNLEIIGEAANKIPVEIQKKYSEVPWRQIIGLRNIVIHEYFNVDIPFIWGIVTKHLLDTKKQFIEMKKNEPQE